MIVLAGYFEVLTIQRRISFKLQLVFFSSIRRSDKGLIDFLGELPVGISTSNVVQLGQAAGGLALAHEDRALLHR